MRRHAALAMAGDHGELGEDGTTGPCLALRAGALLAMQTLHRHKDMQRPKLTYKKDDESVFQKVDDAFWRVYMPPKATITTHAKGLYW